MGDPLFLNSDPICPCNPVTNFQELATPRKCLIFGFDLWMFLFLGIGVACVQVFNDAHSIFTDAKAETLIWLLCVNFLGSSYC